VDAVVICPTTPPPLILATSYFASFKSSMPRISEFLGIFVYMYYDDVNRHHAPHIHVRYGEYKAVFAIETAHLLAGRIKSRQQALIQKWISVRKEELKANWGRALGGEKLEWIDPL
jgi:hypothetical protein